MQTPVALSSRIVFLAILYSVLFTEAPAAPAKSRLDSTTYLQLGPMFGHTGPTETRIWAKASGPAELSIELSEREDFSTARRVQGPVLNSESDFMGHVIAGGLQPAQRYFYRVLLNGAVASPPPWPSFVTAPAEGTTGRVRFAFSSCLGYSGADAAAAWGDLIRTNFDLLLLLGDNHYANTNEPVKQRAAYYDHRRIPAAQEVTQRTPTYAIWDDHDYGPDNSDATLPGKEQSLKTFQQFWPNPAYGEKDNPGVYFKFSRGNLDFFMLDVRYHRSPNKATNLLHKTMLGARQLAWLKEHLLESKAPVKFIASGSEWQSHGTEDSWKSFASERQEIFDFIRDKQITGVILLSGDRHFTGGYQVQGRLIEITAGPFGSKNIQTKNLPEMFLNQSEGKLYCIFDVDTQLAEPKITLEVYRAGEGLVERRPFAWEEVLGRKRIESLPPSPSKTPTK